MNDSLAGKRPNFKAVKNYFALHEWLVLLVGLLILAAGLGAQNGLGRVDQTIYDKLMTMSGRPARADVIIIAIDDYSLAQLGRWPWPRGLHANLIDQVMRSQPRVIGLDIIFSEPEAAPATGDAQLQAAIERAGRVVLPLTTAQRGQGLVAAHPLAALEKAALGLGHIELNIDRDGVVRSTYLYEGDATQMWPHFALQVGGERLWANYPVQAAPPVQSSLTGWRRSDRVLIPFSGSSGHIRSVPYVSVLRGEVPAEFFKDKYVLVGATAVGMADSYPTPVTGEAGAMAGVEINATILASLLDKKTLVPISPGTVAALSCVPVLIALLCCYLFSPRTGLIVSAGLFLVTGIITLLAFRAGLWLPPGAACIALLIAYPLWSWRRLEAAIDYLGRELRVLDSEPHLLPEARPAAVISADVLDRHINAMKLAVQRVRDLRRFVSDCLDSLPDATLVTTLNGTVLLANSHALDYFDSVGLTQVHGIRLPLLLSTPTQTAPHVVDPSRDVGGEIGWWDLLDPLYAATFSEGVEFSNTLGATLLVRSAACRSDNQQLAGWIVSIVDISAIRAAERSRDDTLRFLSHDMRAPQASILALLELQGNPASVLPQPELFARIEKASRRTLGLADNFVQLARAESHDYRLDEVDFHDLVCDASDEFWSQAKSRRITIRNGVDDLVHLTSGDCVVRVDRSLMTRALGNLLSNAINYSAAGSQITWSMHVIATSSGRHLVCNITDQGVGIAEADQANLFHRFHRVESPGQVRHDGIGLGLVFVKTVVERHHGTIALSSIVGVGSTFTITLPLTTVSSDDIDSQLAASAKVDPKL